MQSPSALKKKKKKKAAIAKESCVVTLVPQCLRNVAWSAFGSAKTCLVEVIICIHETAHGTVNSHCQDRLAHCRANQSHTSQSLSKASLKPD